MKKNVKIVIVIVVVIIIFGAIIGAIVLSKQNNNTSADITEAVYSIDQSDTGWEDFIGDNKGSTGEVTSTPEVDDMGNEIESKTEVKKTDTDKSEDYVKFELNISENTSPEVCLEKWMEGVKKNDWTQVQLLSYGFAAVQESSETGAAHYVFEALSWKIGKSVIKDETAFLQVTLKVPDVKNAVVDYSKNTNFDADNSETHTLIDNDMKELVKKAKQESVEIEVILLKDEGIWKIYVTDELLNSISGGLTKVYTEFHQETYGEVVNP